MFVIRFALYLLIFSLGQNIFAALPCNEVLNRLMEGNQRFVDGNLLHSDLNAERRLQTAKRQNPFAVIVGCSDSRVSPEILFDQGIGDLFVVRVAGNVVGPIELDSIEYSVLYLGSSLILVMGHESCGAVDTVLKGETTDIEAVAEKIEPALRGLPKTGKNAVENAVKANARYVANYVKSTPAIKKLVLDNKVKVLPAYYDFMTGKVEILND